MAVVFEAEHLKLRQRVAVKMLRSELALQGELVARFEREARAATRLTSPHVAQVTDVDALPSGEPFMVMEFLEGRDLASELETRGPLPVHDAVRYLIQACSGMEEAHARGIVHRDLKPSNLFLTLRNGAEIVKVLDFGISKIESPQEAHLTSTFSAMGTALYMSPEQVRSAKKVDARTDVWSLGAALYELLSGKPPFLGESATAVVAAIVSEPVPSLRERRPDVPEALEAVVLHALEKDRERRIASVSAFARELAPFATPSDVVSAPLITTTGSLRASSRTAFSTTRPTLAPKTRWTGLAIVGLALAGGAGTWLAFQGRPTESPETTSPTVVSGAQDELSNRPPERATPTAATPPTAPSTSAAINERPAPAAPTTSTAAASKKSAVSMRTKTPPPASSARPKAAVPTTAPKAPKDTPKPASGDDDLL
jgi:serine/threonine-protein kinase